MAPARVEVVEPWREPQGAESKGPRRQHAMARVIHQLPISCRDGP